MYMYSYTCLDVPPVLISVTHFIGGLQMFSMDISLLQILNRFIEPLSKGLNMISQLVHLNSGRIIQQGPIVLCIDLVVVSDQDQLYHS